MSTLHETESLLAIDVCSGSTRAFLFDMVGEQYRLLGTGFSPTTDIAPYQNISEGVRVAIENLQSVTGRSLVDQGQQLIIPSQPDGSGVDRFTATISAGEPLKVVVLGLLEDVSLASAMRLAQSTYARIVQTISINDKRRTDTRMNMLIQTRPDLIVAAGGTDGGATQSLMQLLEAVGLVNFIIPDGHKPEILFAGNQSVQNDLKSLVEGGATWHFVGNIRPVLDAEYLDSASTALAQLTVQLIAKRIAGIDELKIWSGGVVLPGAFAFSRVIRFLSKALSIKKGVMGVDIGASASTLITALNGELSMHVYPQFGLGTTGMEYLLEEGMLADILQWSTILVTENQLKEYLWNKSVYPQILPATDEEMAIEQALARVMLQSTLKMAFPDFPSRLAYLRDGNIPLVEPILASGGVISNNHLLGHTALLILDGLQPVGITTIIIDQNQIAPALGAAASFNQQLVIQVLESNSFLNLGTVIAPVVRAKLGWPVLHIKMNYENGQETIVDVKQGSVISLPLAYGQTARVKINPMHGADIGMGSPGRGGGFTVKGGALGVIIDARGRPLVLPKNPRQRYELYHQWLTSLGDQ